MKNIRWILTAAIMVAISFQASAQQNQLITNTPTDTQKIESDYHPDDLAAPTPASPAAVSGKQEGIQTIGNRPVRLSSDGVPALAVPDEKRGISNPQKNKSENN